MSRILINALALHTGFITLGKTLPVILTLYWLKCQWHFYVNKDANTTASRSCKVIRYVRWFCNYHNRLTWHWHWKKSQQQILLKTNEGRQHGGLWFCIWGSVGAKCRLEGNMSPLSRLFFLLRSLLHFYAFLQHFTCLTVTCGSVTVCETSSQWVSCVWTI